MDIEELKTLLRKPAHTEEECARIVGLIDFRVPPGSLDAEPPLSALIYAAQGILFPALSFNPIPDPLDILSQVERVREFSREHAKWALIGQRFFETRPDPNVRVLQKSDKYILKKALKPERLDVTRRIYACIHSPAPEEQARLSETALSCFRFMHDAKLWEEQRLRELNVSILPGSYYDNDQSFQGLKFKFIGDIDIVEIVDSITLYQKKSAPSGPSRAMTANGLL